MFELFKRLGGWLSFAVTQLPRLFVPLGMVWLDESPPPDPGETQQLPGLSMAEGSLIRREDKAYSEAFLQAFIEKIPGVIAEIRDPATVADTPLLEAFPDPGERMDVIQEAFLQARQSVPQSDFWMEPHLLLDGDVAILLFKDGPNHRWYGSQLVGYRVPFDRALPAIDQDLRNKLSVPSSAFRDRFEDEEYLYLAMRSIQHAPILKISGGSLGVLYTVEEAYRKLPRAERLDRLGEAFDRNFETATTWLNSAFEGHAKVRRRAVERSRWQKIMRADETALIRKQLQQAAVCTYRAVTILKSLPEIKKASGVSEGDRLAAWVKTLEWYIRGTETQWEILASLVAFAEKGRIDLDRRVSLQNLLELAFVEGPFHPATLQGKAINSRFTLEGLDRAARETISVPGNVRFFAFVLENLVRGADKASRGDQKVRCRVSADSEYIYFSAADDGWGISQANLSKVSDDDFTTRAGETGHAVTRRVVEGQGGWVKIDTLTWPESAAEERLRRRRLGLRTSVGTTITVAWPRQSAILLSASSFMETLPQFETPPPPITIRKSVIDIRRAKVSLARAEAARLKKEATDKAEQERLAERRFEFLGTLAPEVRNILEQIWNSLLTGQSETATTLRGLFGRRWLAQGPDALSWEKEMVSLIGRHPELPFEIAEAENVLQNFAGWSLQQLRELLSDVYSMPLADSRETEKAA